MKYQPGLLDNFISPTTGQLASEAHLPAIPEGYIWIGDRDGNAFPSLLLKDLLLDFQTLRANLDESSFILQAPMEFLGSAQALNQLEDGLLKHHEGVIQIAIPDVDYVSKETLEEYVKQAQEAAQEAKQSASQAKQSAGEAKQSADSAEIAKALASFSASQASLSATTATTAAASAVQSATASAGSAAAAAASALVAAAAALGASSSADDAKEYRDEALALRDLIKQYRDTTLMYRDQAKQYSDDALMYRDQSKIYADQAAASAQEAKNYLQQLLNTGISLIGDVMGSGPLKDPIHLELMLRLNEIKKPVGQVDMNNQALVNLETLEAGSWTELESKATNGINFLFLWKLLGGGVR